MFRHLLQSCPLCDRRSASSSIIVPTFTTLRQLQKHLRQDHARALGLAAPSATKPVVRSCSSSATSRRQRLAARRELLRQFGPIESPRSLNAAVNTLVPTLRPSTRHFIPTSLASRDGVSLLCAKYASSSSSSSSPTVVVLVDYANLPEWATLLDRADPGAERFLTQSDATIVVVAEPRAPLSTLFLSRFARNLRTAASPPRIAVHRCRRAREAGDLVMADVAVRIAVTHAAAVGDAPTRRLQLHVLGNDLRHRRCLSNVLRLGNVDVVGHHAFSGNECAWLEAMERMLEMISKES